MMKFLQDMTDFVFVENEPEQADIIFIPGSDLGAHALTAARLYGEGYAPFIMPSGKYAKGTGHTTVEGFETECDFLTDILLKNGVPRSAILQEKNATYTYENAIFSRKLADSFGLSVKKAILCSQAYHARRSLLYYEVQFPDTEFLVCPTVTREISRDNWFLDREKTRLVLGELERCGTQFHEIIAGLGGR